MSYQIKLRVVASDDLLTDDINRLQKEIAERIPIEARALVDGSTPRGRIYQRSAITARRTATGLRLGFKPSGKSRMVVGRRFHRASAPGQPWAKDTGRAYRDISVSLIGRGKYRVTFGAPYIGYLEFKLNRPVVIPAIERAFDHVLNQ